MKVIKLCLVSDYKRSVEENIFVLNRAISNGFQCIQIREKQNDPWRLFEIVRGVQANCKNSAVSLIINDEWRVAKEFDLDGVHVGPRDEKPSIIRKCFGPHKVIGWSIENLEQLNSEELQFCDYVSISPVFKTLSKLDCVKPLGIRAIQYAKSKLKIPVWAIGGIHVGNLHGLIEANVDGICALSDIFNAQDKIAQIRKWMNVIENSNTQVRTL